MMKILRGPLTTTTTAAFMLQRRGMVNLHGHAESLQRNNNRLQGSVSLSERTHVVTGERPADPSSLLNDEDLRREAEKLIKWWRGYNVLCLTGAGMSTESGIPDYRGHEGSYHQGHKPMIHEEFMKSSYQRQRYWGRGMVGWRYFDEKEPNAGHYALTQLEKLGKLGVSFEDTPDYYVDEDEYMFGAGQQTLSVITQNVDSLHRRAGTKHLVELHGRTDQLTCMMCGAIRDRRSFHEELEALNKEWWEAVLRATESSDMRADGDAAVATKNYDAVKVPPCQHCRDGFLKPKVVFFGDSVPAHRVKLCQGAVDECTGLLVVGSSLAVHSAFRYVRAAHYKGIPIAILNVGETRAETEELDVLKIEAPAGPTLSIVAEHFALQERIKKNEESWKWKRYS